MPSSNPSGTTPDQVRNTSDPGDETQRNFRYQHSYAVILLVAAKLGTRQYSAVWCEHHEDFLAERSDGRFDGFQIKTSRPESGPWHMLDGEIVKSIGRFTDLVQEFGEHIADLYFVSNTSYQEVTVANTDEVRRGKCPRLFLDHVHSCSAIREIAPPFRDVFQTLLAGCGCTEELLYEVLQRMDIVLGPPRDSFDAVIAHEHLGALPECKGLPPAVLDGFRDEIVAKVYRASSLHVTDPARHVRQLTHSNLSDPALAGKRLVVADVLVYSPSNGSSPPFQFVGQPRLALSKGATKSVLYQKLQKGGLEEDQIEDVADKSRAAESHLMTEAVIAPERTTRVIRQLEAMVLGECRESYLRNSQSSEPFGVPMLIDVQDRLRRLAGERAHMVVNHEYECLLGIAGMLTDDCLLWWSKRFPIEPVGQE